MIVGGSEDIIRSAVTTIRGRGHVDGGAGSGADRGNGMTVVQARGHGRLKTRKTHSWTRQARW